MKNEISTYYSYGHVFESKAKIFRPKSIEELRSIVMQCRAAGRKITPAGRFHSFDQQNSGNDVVIGFEHFQQMTYDPQTHQISVGPGVSWGEIVDKAYQHFCVPYTCITCSKPTAAGTLSVNTYSMWTPGVGKEGNHCVALQVMTTEGKILNCSRQENSDLFYGVISGLGMLGFILSITYQLLYVGQHFSLEITTQNYDDIEDIEHRLDLRKANNLQHVDQVRSQSTLFYTDKGQAKFMVYNRRYKLVEKKLPDSKFRFYQSVLANGAIRLFPSLVNKMLKSDAQRSDDQKWLLKGLHSIKHGTFWAEADYYWTTYCGPVFRPLGYQSHLYQMTHFIPTGENKITVFTKFVYQLLKKYELKFCMFDLMYIPQDEPFVLSTSRDSDGFHVNTTFMDYVRPDAVHSFYQELNALAYEMGGKIYLAKNCFIKPELLEKMHEKEIQEFYQIKQKYDPGFVLTSNFISTYFPSYFS